MNKVATQKETTPDRHARDPQTYVGRCIGDISAFGDKDCKAGIIPAAMPESVIEFFATLPDAELKSLIDKKIPINPKTGIPELSPKFNTLSDASRDFILSVSKAFNAMGDWPAYFAITRDREQYLRGAQYFHYEGMRLSEGTSHEEPFTRLMTTVSNTQKGRSHETEILLTEGLQPEQLATILENKTAYKDLPKAVQEHIYITQSGDLYLTKGVIAPHTADQLMHKCGLHRATTRNRDPDDTRRVALTWDRDVQTSIDPA